MLKLSEAIRLGSMLNPQAFTVREMVDSSGTVHTCALGAAEKAGWLMAFSDYTLRIFPACPQCGRKAFPYQGLLGAIVHLNDAHRWTRERIADWVQTQEVANAVCKTAEMQSVG